LSRLLDVQLDNFEGPLDLLIHLIYKNELDIYNISISVITDRFVEAVNDMEKLDIEVAAEFINMASYLIYLKSRMLLPRDNSFEEDFDPEEEKYLLTQKLVEYSFYKDVSNILVEKEQMSSKHLMRTETLYIPKEELETEDAYKIASLFFELINKEKDTKLLMEKDSIDINTIIDRIRELVFEKHKMFWSEALKYCSSKKEVVVSLLAVLELVKQRVIMAIQTETFGDILLEKKEAG